MKLNIPLDWCEKMARREAGAEISVGIMAFDPVFQSNTQELHPLHDDSKIPLNRFINLMRRNKGLTLEQLSERADIDLRELLSIEEDPHHTPEVRTIYQLSKTFSVSQQKLMALSGLMKSKDLSYVEEAVRYAARSASIERLNDDEQAALDGFIAVLSER